MTRSPNASARASIFGLPPSPPLCGHPCHSRYPILRLLLFAARPLPRDAVRLAKDVPQSQWTGGWRTRTQLSAETTPKTCVALTQRGISTSIDRRPELAQRLFL